jgi:hypothetical protein
LRAPDLIPEHREVIGTRGERSVRRIFTHAAVLTMATSILVVGSGRSGAATTCRVGNARTHAVFTTLQDAVDGARDDEALRVRGCVLALPP